MEQLSNELLVGLLAALIINSLVLVLFRYRVRGHVLLNVVALFYWMQVGWLILSCLISGSSKLLINTELVLDLNEAPFRVPLGLTIMPLVALVCAAIIPGDARNLTAMRSVVKRRHRTMSFLMYFFALAPLFYYVATMVLGDSVFGAPFMYMYLSLFTTPVLLGICRRRYRGPVVVFLCATLISAFLAFGQGSRTLIFMPAVFFTAGVWLTVNFRRRVAMLVIALLIFLPIFYYSAMIEDVRTTIRNSTGQTIMTRAAGIVELIVQNEDSGNTMQEALRGIDRMIMMSNLAVLVWTPEDIPYRGFGDMLDEIKYTNRTTLDEEGRDLAALQFDYEAGLGAANIYGFQAGVGGTVPFPVLADGWSRAGLIGAAGFSLILCFMLGLVEIFCSAEVCR